MNSESFPIFDTTRASFSNTTLLLLLLLRNLDVSDKEKDGELDTMRCDGGVVVNAGNGFDAGRGQARNG